MTVASLDVRDVLLSDGGAARIRLLRDDDLEQVRALYERSSENSRYFRFFSPLPVDAAMRNTRPPADDARHCMLVAEVDGGVVAMAEYDAWATARWPRSRSWWKTSSRVVASGPILLESLVQRAAAPWHPPFRAAYLRQNQRMPEVFAHAGFEVRWEHR